MNLQKLRQDLESKKTLRDDISRRLSAEKVKLRNNKFRLIQTEKAQKIVQIVSQETQSKLEYRISELASLANKSIFDDPYEVKLKYEIKRNKTEANIYFEKGGESFNPIGSSGGGVVDVASFTLRLAIWNLSLPKSSPVIVLDEPFKWLSADLQSRAAEMVREVSKKLGVQIVMITHINDLINASDKNYRVVRRNNISKVS